MFKRLFLAATIAVPLYLTIALQPTSPSSDEMNRDSHQVIKKIEQTMQNFRQQLNGQNASRLNDNY
jgi:LytS/YehU family sensor histidine kinase